METREYRTVDKSQWMDGEWKSEPDKIQWQDPATGLPCLIVRGPSGALCGYVGVAETHPQYKKSYHELPNVNVHGGLTFANLCQPSEDESHGICHTPAPGEPDHVWWFGFDCAHYGDTCPNNPRPFGLFSPRESYKNLSYVKSQVTKLAHQLAEGWTR